jgi:hypothetical protein
MKSMNPDLSLLKMIEMVASAKAEAVVERLKNPIGAALITHTSLLAIKMKECSRCLTKKPISEFYSRKLKSGNISTRSHCKQCENQQCKNYHEDNRDIRLKYRKEYNKIYYAENSIGFKVRAKLRKENIKKCTPKWLSDAFHAEIQGVYHYAGIMHQITGVSHHVDHVVPVNGMMVSGLHVPWNLKAIPAVENIAKSNHFTTS